MENKPDAFAAFFISAKQKIGEIPQRIKGFCQSPSFPAQMNKLLRTGLMLVACLLLSIILICLCSKTPLTALSAFFQGPFADKDSLAQILDEALPLIFTGAGVCIMNKAGQCNMFVEGGFFAGAFLAAYLAPIMPLPPFWIHLFCILAGGLVSGLIGYIPAALKAHLGINEFVSSLMLNYIVFWIVMYLLDGPCADPDVANKTRYLEDFMKLAVIDEDTGLTGAIFIALAIAILAYIFLSKTIWGYRIRITGDNPRFAEYCGIKTKRPIIYSQVLGAFLAGLGGAVLMLGGARNFRFEWKALPNYGFDGFVIAIMADNNPLLVPLASLFLGYLRVGATKMAVLSDVPNQMVYIIQAAIIILFGARYAFKLIKAKKAEEPSSVPETGKGGS
jgi:simple sugar transport system permease protein